jgi:lysophospholipase L1-like esterase
VQSIRTKCPNTKVLLLGIFPRNRELEEARADAIRQINPTIAKLDDGKMVRYLDLTSKFVGPDGRASKELMPDYLHPNSKGYDTWAKEMHPLLDEMLKN